MMMSLEANDEQMMSTLPTVGGMRGVVHRQESACDGDVE